MNLGQGAVLAHRLPHPGIGEAVVGLIVAGRGVELFASGVQILGAGNAEDLLDDVGDFYRG
jgi:hypothetical protein